MDSDENDSSSSLLNFVMAIVKVINFVIDALLRLPLILSAIITSFLLGLPVVGAWYLFTLAFSLHPLLRAILIWSVLLSLIILAAVVDYLRSSSHS